MHELGTISFKANALKLAGTTLIVTALFPAFLMALLV
jgi:hypothetical protein